MQVVVVVGVLSPTRVAKVQRCSWNRLASVAEVDISGGEC